MYLYGFDEQKFGWLTGKNSIYYHPDGSINLDEVHYQLSHIEKNTSKLRSYELSWSLYFFFTADMSNVDHLKLMYRIWNTFNKNDKHNWLPALEMWGPHVDIMRNTKPFLDLLLEQSTTKSKTAVPALDLLEFGLSFYQVVHPNFDAPLNSFIPKVDLSTADSKSKFMKSALSYPHFSFVQLTNRAYTDGFKDLGEGLIRLYFRRLFVKFVKSSYSVEDAMNSAWPCMHEHGVSMVETLKDIRATTKGKSFFNDLFAWYNATAENESSLIIEARLQFTQVVEDVIQQRTTSKEPWSYDDYTWMVLCSNMKPENPLYAPTRTRVAEGLFNSIQKTSIDVLFYIALKSGPDTFDAFLHRQKEAGILNANILALLTSYSTPKLKWIVQQPMLKDVLNPTQLFNHFYVNKHHYLSQDLYQAYQLIQKPEVKEISNGLSLIKAERITEVIRGMQRLHMHLFEDRTLLQDMSKEVSMELHALVGSMTYLTWLAFNRDVDLQLSSSTLLRNDDFEPSNLVNVLCVIDPDFVTSHRENIRMLMHSTNIPEAMAIYQSWLKEWFGDLIFNDDYSSTFVRDNASLMHYFKAQYLAQRPELGNVVEEIELGDLF